MDISNRLPSSELNLQLLLFYTWETLVFDKGIHVGWCFHELQFFLPNREMIAIKIHMSEDEITRFLISIKEIYGERILEQPFRRLEALPPDYDLTISQVLKVNGQLTEKIFRDMFTSLRGRIIFTAAKHARNKNT